MAVNLAKLLVKPRHFQINRVLYSLYYKVLCESSGDVVLELRYLVAEDMATSRYPDDDIVRNSVSKDVNSDSELKNITISHVVRGIPLKFL